MCYIGRLDIPIEMAPGCVYITLESGPMSHAEGLQLLAGSQEQPR